MFPEQRRSDATRQSVGQMKHLRLLKRIEVENMQSHESGAAREHARALDFECDIGYTIQIGARAQVCSLQELERKKGKEYSGAYMNAKIKTCGMTKNV